MLHRIARANCVNTNTIAPPLRAPVLGLVVGIVGLLGNLSACATVSKSARSGSYRESARANYQKGLSEFKTRNYLEAMRYFNFVKRKFSFSRFATYAELRIADVYFAQEQFPSAVDAYKIFSNFHPTHPQVRSGYVAFRIAKAQVSQIPNDWFLIPPSYEKDQSGTHRALRELTFFRQRYSKSKYLKDIKKLYGQCLDRIVAHELYVAEFYFKRNKPRASLMRIEGILKNYPDAGRGPKFMLLLGKIQLRLGQKKEAQLTLNRVLKHYATRKEGARARTLLREANL